MVSTTKRPASATSEGVVESEGHHFQMGGRLSRRLSIERGDRVFGNFLNVAERRLRRENQSDDRLRLFGRIRARRDIFELASDKAAEAYEAEGPGIDFLEWLLENFDSILAMILKIIDLFS